jgi:hypothetical protein
VISKAFHQADMSQKSVAKGKPDAEGGTGMTQFGRALHEINVDILCANSAPAKGRIERCFGTLQDRLVKETPCASSPPPSSGTPSKAQKSGPSAVSTLQRGDICISRLQALIRIIDIMELESQAV